MEEGIARKEVAKSAVTKIILYQPTKHAKPFMFTIFFLFSLMCLQASLFNIYIHIQLKDFAFSFFEENAEHNFCIMLLESVGA